MSVGIYSITNKVNGKVYIGQSINIERRWAEHKKHYDNKDGRCKKVEKDWHIYGKDTFEFKIIEIINIDGLSKYDRSFLLEYREHYYMCKYNSVKNGYNTPNSFYRKKNAKEFNGQSLPKSFYENLDILLEIDDIWNRINWE